MNLVNNYKIREILDYEEKGLNIIEELSCLNIDVIIDMIKLGNHCSVEEAEDILKINYEKYTLEEIAEELVYSIVGRRAENGEETYNENDAISFSDILNKYYDDIAALDSKLNISEFWEMSTSYLHKYADGVGKRFVKEKNMQIRMQYNMIGMFMQALAGKLKQCPELKENGQLEYNDLISKIKNMQNKK